MEQTCPRCKTTSYQNPTMKLMVNVCGHRMCESCIDSVFTRPSASCPECGVVLRRNQYRLQQFDDWYIEKEVEIRKRILKDFNKCEDDFQTLRDFNDYLEDVETIVYNLANGVDVEATKANIEKYKQENQSLILKNRQKQLRDEQYVKSKLEFERQQVLLRNKQLKEEEVEAIKTRKRLHDTLLDTLISSDRPADEVFAEAMAAKRTKDDDESSVVTSSITTKTQYQEQQGTITFEPLPIDTGTLYSYKPLIIESYGPALPAMEELEGFGYLANVKRLDVQVVAGGFLPAHACHRALEEAYSCLMLSLGDR